MVETLEKEIGDYILSIFEEAGIYYPVDEGYCQFSFEFCERYDGTVMIFYHYLFANKIFVLDSFYVSMPEFYLLVDYKGNLYYVKIDLYVQYGGYDIKILLKFPCSKEQYNELDNYLKDNFERMGLYFEDLNNLRDLKPIAKKMFVPYLLQ